MADSSKTTASRVADVVVLIISLVILMLGFIAWRVYAASPQRNAYDMAVAIHKETASEVATAREGAASILTDCAARSGMDEACAALQTAYDATATIVEPPTLSRLTSATAYVKETEAVEASNTQLSEALAAFEDNTVPVQEAILVRIIEKVGPVRDPMLEAARIAQGEVNACQDVINSTEGQVTNESVRTQAQEAVDSLQNLINQSNVLLSENPDDYTALTAQIHDGVAQVTNWINQVNLDHWDWATRNGIGQVYDPKENTSNNVAE